MNIHGNQPNKRKRSGRVALTTMAALGGSMALAGCGDGGSAPAANAAKMTQQPPGSEEVQVFQNVFECASKTDLTKDQCADKRSEAVALAEKEAPRFAALEDCEAEYGEGQCAQPQDEERRYSGRSHFSPFLGAFFWSRMNKSEGQPLFKGKDGAFQTANGTRLSYGGAPGKYYAGARAFERARSVPKVKAASAGAKAAAKGGFGETSRGWRLSNRSGSKSSSSYSRGG